MQSIRIVRLADNEVVCYLSIDSGNAYTVAPWEGDGDWDDIWEARSGDCVEHVAAWVRQRHSAGYGAEVC